MKELLRSDLRFHKTDCGRFGAMTAWGLKDTSSRPAKDLGGTLWHTIQRKLHDMTLRLDSLYDVIVELEEKIEDARLRRDAIKQQAITLENIYKIMVNFDCVYNIINDEEKRNVVTALIKEIEIYRNDESEYPLKRIGLNFPVFKDGGEVTELLWDKGNTVETVCLLVK